MDRDPRNVGSPSLHVADMHPDPHSHVRHGQARLDGWRAALSPRSVDGNVASTPSPVLLTSGPPVPRHLLSDDPVVAVEHLLPAGIAEGRGLFGRADDVGEEDTAQRALWCGQSALAGGELRDHGEQRVDVLTEPVVVESRQRDTGAAPGSSRRPDRARLVNRGGSPAAGARVSAPRSPPAPSRGLDDRIRGTVVEPRRHRGLSPPVRPAASNSSRNSVSWSPSRTHPCDPVLVLIAHAWGQLDRLSRTGGLVENQGAQRAPGDVPANRRAGPQ